MNNFKFAAIDKAENLRADLLKPSLDLSLLYEPPSEIGLMSQEDQQMALAARSRMAERAKRAFAEGDVDGFCDVFPGHQAFDAVMANAAILQQHGMFEKAFVSTFDRANINNWRFPPALVARRLTECDKAKLRAAGQPLPKTQDGRHTLYRGVSGRGKYRRVRGLSWTDSLPVACWFALRYADRLYDPAVYVARIAEDEVFYYNDGRSEREFVCYPKRCRRLTLTTEKMKTLARQHEKTIEDDIAFCRGGIQG